MWTSASKNQIILAYQDVIGSGTSYSSTHAWGFKL